MASENEKVNKESPQEKKPADDSDLDGRIEQARRYHEAVTKHGDKAGPKLPDKDPTSSSTKGDDDERSSGGDLKMEVERSYIHNLREEAKENRLAKEELAKEAEGFRQVMRDFFQVDDPQALKDKLEQTQRLKEKDEEGRLSKIDLMEKKLRESERTMEEERIKFEQDRQELKQQRDKIIVQNALIQSAVSYDVANPKQLLRLLENEFYVDPDRLTPLYRTEEGPISLEERVKIFLDEPENWNLVRSKIAQGGGTSGKAGASSRPAFTRAELKEMRAKRPEEYKARQTEIQRAYKEGRVRPD